MNENLVTTQKVHILVVDDTRDNLRLLSNMLTEQGYKVRPAPDGRRAISSAQSRLPDLILLDIMMPGMDGYAVCEQLRADERTKEIPVIFLSALNETMDKVRAFNIGGVDYITKPFQAEEVLARVKTHLELAGMRKHLQEQNTLLSQEIVEHKRTKAELQRARDAADAANTAKSVFLSNMSHELRSPLTAILGFVQVMVRSSTLPPEHHENVDIIRRSGEHLLTLINQVLELSKIEAGRMALDETNVDVYRLLADVEDMFRVKAEEKHVRLLVEQSEEVPQYVRTDEIKLRQVLINVLNNALKFTEEGGVAVRVRRVFSHQSSVFSEQRSSDNCLLNTDNCILVFEVEDSGPGITPEEIEHVFEAFRQTETGRQSSEGTGLGLPISRQFIRLMGGDMQVKSEAGHGTLFTFEIQVQVVEAADIEPGFPTRRIIALEPGQSRYRILIVDDRMTNRQLVVKLLAPFGFDLREAANGEDAIELCETWKPHLIWMDMRMPVMDGYEATRQIKATAAGQTTKIIALTASSFEEERAIILAAGCDDYLRKPFREEELFELMSKHIGVRFVYEEDKQSSIDNLQSTIDNALVALPAEWLANLKQGAEEVDVELLFSVIEQIRGRDAALAAALTRLVEDFEYDGILAIIQHIKRGGDAVEKNV